MKKVKVFIPATVSNVACGFDILGFPIKSFGDEMIVRKPYCTNSNLVFLIENTDRRS